MIDSKGKISVRQATLLYLTCICSPAVRFVPNYTATYANQAGWLSPIVSFVFMLPLIFILQSFFNKYPNSNLSDVFEHICGKIIGKIVILLYLLLVLLLTAVYVRYYAERLLSTIMPNVSIYVFLVPMLFLVAIALRKGIVVLSRMNEVIITVVFFIFVLSVIFSIPGINPDNLLPVSRLDVPHIARASIGTLGLWVYFLFLFFFGDSISGKENIKKISLQALLITTISTIFLIMITIGNLGAPLVKTLPIPYFISIKQITLFQTIERIESLIVSMWMLSDFIIISVFIYSTMCIFKHLFKLQETKPLVSIYALFILFASLLMSRNGFQLQDLSERILINANIIWGLGIPIIIFAVGKLRKKI